MIVSTLADALVFYSIVNVSKHSGEVSFRMHTSPACVVCFAIAAAADAADVALV